MSRVHKDEIRKLSEKFQKKKKKFQEEIRKREEKLSQITRDCEILSGKLEESEVSRAKSSEEFRANAEKLKNRNHELQEENKEILVFLIKCGLRKPIYF